MTITATNTRVQISSIVFLRLVNSIENMFAAFSNWNDSRQTFNALSDLSDRDLEDIGLNRGDIYAIAGK